LIEVTQATVTFNHEIDDESCEVKATYFAGRVTINAVRCNSDYRFVNLTPAQEREVKSIVLWTVQDMNN
jgi:hypothetical protein